MFFPSLESFKLGLNPNPRCAGVPNAVYLVPTSDHNVLEYMRTNYERVFPIIMENTDIHFYFLPETLKNGHLKDCLAYNNPSFTIPEEHLFPIIDKFVTRIAKINNLNIGRGGIALMDFNDPTTVIDFYPIDPDRDISPQLNEWMLDLQPRILLSRQSSPNAGMSNGKVYKGGDNIYVDTFIYPNIKFSLDTTPRPADDQFDEYGYNIAKEIRDRIEILKQRGFLKLIAALADELQETTTNTSRLRITKDYRILLSDWNDREVVMSPLPKTVFILFLNHPEGILFKELVDYKEEIRNIYKNITLRENIDDIESSLSALVDPMNNSINEKCSRIRAAFLEVIAPHLASSYHITGKKAEPKKILIDRNLVIID